MTRSRAAGLSGGYLATSQSSLRSLILGAIDVVYGDIGTRALYAVKEVFVAGHVSFAMLPATHTSPTTGRPLVFLHSGIFYPSERGADLTNLARLDSAAEICKVLLLLVHSLRAGSALLRSAAFIKRASRLGRSESFAKLWVQATSLSI
jgi:hypothetical protein